jgi:ABC-2 type transport system permease protein
VSTIAHARALSWRAVLNIVRQPQQWAPSIFFPLFFAALNTAALGKTTALPGFPAADSFLDFMMAATIVQGVLFGGVGAASEMAQDIENGFFERLVAAPTARVSILLGRLAGGAVLGATQSIVFFVIFAAFGAEVKAGLAGILVLVLCGMLLALAIGAIGTAMALRTGSVEAVQGAFPLVFISLFASSAFFPRELMRGWFHAVATYNPFSWMIDGLRELILVGWSSDDAFAALAVPFVITTVGVAISLRQLQHRLAVAA